MGRARRWLGAALLLSCAGGLRAQDLDPRAYSNAPVGTNIAAAAYSRVWGDVLLDPSLPLDDVTAATTATRSGTFAESISSAGRPISGSPFPT